MMPDDESDVIIMNHNIGVRWPSGKCVSDECSYIRTYCMAYTAMPFQYPMAYSNPLNYDL